MRSRAEAIEAIRMARLELDQAIVNRDQEALAEMLHPAGSWQPLIDATRESSLAAERLTAALRDFIEEGRKGWTTTDGRW